MQAARSSAMANLVRSIDVEAPAYAAAVGLPSRAQATILLSALKATVFAYRNDRYREAHRAASERG